MEVDATVNATVDACNDDAVTFFDEELVSGSICCLQQQAALLQQQRVFTKQLDLDREMQFHKENPWTIFPWCGQAYY